MEAAKRILFFLSVVISLVSCSVGKELYIYGFESKPSAKSVTAERNENLSLNHQESGKDVFQSGASDSLKMGIVSEVKSGVSVGSLRQEYSHQRSTKPSYTMSTMENKLERGDSPSVIEKESNIYTKLSKTDNKRNRIPWSDILSWITWIITVGGLVSLIGLGLHALFPSLSLIVAVLIGFPLLFLILVGFILIFGVH